MKLRLILIFLAFIVMGGGIFIMGLRTMYNEHRLSSTGKTAPVLRLVNLQGGGNADEVHFKTEDGEEQTVRMVVPMDVRNRLNSHQDVSIDYLPNDPTINRWTGENNGTGFLTLMGVVIMVVGMLFWKWVRR